MSNGASVIGFDRELAARLAERQRLGLLRTLALPAGIDLTSNDYLGFATDPVLAEAIAVAVRGHGAGAGAARLLRGHGEIHADTEAVLAAFCGRQAALTFSSGYAANIGLLQALLGRDDTVLSDAHNHASLIDGIRLSRATCRVFAHQDLDGLAVLLQQPRTGRVFVVTESLFSMDGDLTDLRALADLCDRHDALLLVDEAHATGLYGQRGSGRVEELGLANRVLATVHTGGKALGVGGAWVAGSQALIDWLVNHARSFIYSTAIAPALACGMRAAVQRCATQGAVVAELHAKAGRLRQRLRAAGVDLAASESCILPVILGSSDRAMSVAAALRQDGFDVRAVRPPTVAEGTARLRVTVRGPVAEADFDRFATRLLALQELG